MLEVRGWLAVAALVLCLLTVASVAWSQAWLAGYDAGSARVVESIDVARWGLCDQGGSWVRCARTPDNQLVVIRGMR